MNYLSVPANSVRSSTTGVAEPSCEEHANGANVTSTPGTRTTGMSSDLSQPSTSGNTSPMPSKRTISSAPEADKKHPLTSMDFSKASNEFIYDSLIQALEQMNSTDDIPSFILHQNINTQFDKMTQSQIQRFSDKLIEKLMADLTDKWLPNDNKAKKELGELAGKEMESSNEKTVLTNSFLWLLDTPLLAPALLNFQKRGIDITPLTKCMASTAINYFSAEGINKLLTNADLCRLFTQALDLDQETIAFRLLLTGNFFELMNLVGDGQTTNLGRFLARHTVMFAKLEKRKKIGLVEVSGHELCHRFMIDAATRHSSAFTNQLMKMSAIINALLTSDPTQVKMQDNKGKTPFHLAVAIERNAGCFNALLASYPNQLNMQDNKGRTPLHIATEMVDLTCFCALLCINNINVTIQDLDGCTPLHYACRQGSTERAKGLLFLEPTLTLINMQDNEGRTPLHFATLVNDRMCFDALLTFKNIDASIQDKDGYTPLHYACQQNDKKRAKALLKWDPAQIISQDKKSRAPLHIATLMDDEGCFNVLLSVKNNIQCKLQDIDGYTPLYYACQQGNTKRAKALLDFDPTQINTKDDQGMTPLHRVARIGNVGCFNVLVANGASVSLQDKNGNTPLYIAIQWGNTECVEGLLALDPTQVNRQDKQGRTPLHMATLIGDVGCLNVLVANGASVSVQDKNGNTPLHIAAQRGNIEYFKALLTVIIDGIHLNAKNRHGITPLHVAIQWNHPESVEILLASKGINVHMKDRNGMTPLHLATQWGKTECFNLLIRHGIQVNVRNKSGYTPLHLAAMYGHPEHVMGLLAQAGINVKITTFIEHQTALALAEEGKHQSCINLLGKAKSKIWRETAL